MIFKICNCSIPGCGIFLYRLIGMQKFAKKSVREAAPYPCIIKKLRRFSEWLINMVFMYLKYLLA